MKKTISRPMNFLMISFIALLLSACGGGDSSSLGGDSSSDSGALTLRLTDAPVDGLLEVWVTFTDVIIHPADGSGDIVVPVDDGEGEAGMTIELTSLAGGGSVRLLGDYPLPDGHYSWMRLVIDPDNTYVICDEYECDGDGDGVADSLPLMLDCSSCDQSHLKLNRSFTIGAEGLVDFTIDFDMRKSVTLIQPNSTPYVDNQFKLRPTLRIIDTDVASAQIFGTVDEELVNPAVPDDCAVYVYEGDVYPDDICIDVNGDVCPGSGAQSLTTAEVILEGTNPDIYTYRTGYLYPGTYTVALLCEDDDPEVDDAVPFIGEATVEAVAGDNEHNFEPIP